MAVCGGRLGVRAEVRERRRRVRRGYRGCEGWGVGEESWRSSDGERISLWLQVGCRTVQH